MQLIFVYVKWCGQVHAQLWHGEMTDGHGKSAYNADKIIFKKVLSEDEARMSFAQLKALFPAPEIKED
jgi:hypothetical protein